ncbi:MAG: hypothetical protein IKP23_05580 [Elusimicrobiaceae bacterium]|jgi:hypothetical protein|nr:hypothetical protein [Elusimicrobiaceae bacterium]
MIILRRAILLALVCVAVPVCFPDFPFSAGPMIFGLYIAILLGIVFVSAILSVLPFAKSKIINAFMDIVFMIIAAIIIMMFMPQYDGVHPWTKVKQGRYPTKAQVYRGLSRLGIGSPQEWKDDFKDNVGTIKQGVKKAENVVVKEHKQ